MRVASAIAVMVSAIPLAVGVPTAIAEEVPAGSTSVGIVKLAESESSVQAPQAKAAALPATGSRSVASLSTGACFAIAVSGACVAGVWRKSGERGCHGC